jgi:hemerythrin-like domain-containing protein
MASPVCRNIEETNVESNRRNFLAAATTLGAGVVVPVTALAMVRFKQEKKTEPQEEVGATEDLMREHGVLNRVMLIYEEGLRRLKDKEEVSPDVFHKTATLVRKFVEDYHEKLEENFIFPEFEKQKKLVELVKVLRDQHQAGRRVTDIVLQNATGDRFVKPESQQQIVKACQDFIRMYRPHEAREDTELFPALNKIVPVKRIKELGEQFEKEEDRLFGEEGFEKTVEQVAVIEKQLGINDLAAFTPK